MTEGDPTVDPRLRRLLSRAVGDEGRRPAPGVAVVEGPAGCGKTRLTEELLRLPRVREFHVRVLSFVPAPRVILRRGPERAPAQFAVSAPTRTSSTVTRTVDGAVAAVDVADERGIPLPGGLDELFAALPTKEPLLLVAEDVHRAGEQALSRLRTLLEHPPPGLVTVVTYRPEELPQPGLPLGAAVAHHPESAVVRLRPAPMDAEDVDAYARARLGTERCTPDFVDRLYATTGGLPRTVTDLVQVLAAGEGRLAAEDVDAAGVPVRLAELVAQRLASLPPEHRAVVGAAAVLEEPAALQDLAATAQLPMAQARAALLAAESAGLLLELSGGSYGFDAPLTALAARMLLPGAVREQLHRAAARAVGRRQPVPWAALARHHRGSGQVREWLRAVERAAEQAAEEGRHLEVQGLVAESVTHEGAPQDQRIRLALMMARSAVIALPANETMEVLRHLVDDVDLPAEVRGEIRLDLAVLRSNLLGLGEQGRSDLANAAAELTERPDLAARAMSMLSMPYWPGGPLSEHLQWLERADETAAAAGDPVVQMAVSVNRATVLVNTGASDAWEQVDRLPRDHPEVGCRLQVARGLCNTADSAYWLGEYTRSVELLAEGRKLAARTGATGTARTGRSIELLQKLTAGDWDGLDSLATAYAVETGEGTLSACDADLVRAVLSLAKGDWAQATTFVAEGALSRDAPVPIDAAASVVRIRLALARKDEEGAAAEARAAWARVRRKGVWAWAAEVAPWAVEAVCREGGTEVALEWIDEFTAGVRDLSVPSAVAALERCHAAVAEARGAYPAAADAYRRAADAYAALGRPYDKCLAREGAGRCELAAGAEHSADAGEAGDTGDAANTEDTEDTANQNAGYGRHAAAVEELTESARVLESLGAIWDAARVRATLRSHHRAEPRPVGRPAYGTRLSPREREVAVLAGTGLTNREIADTLHLSSRTVEQHVARALRKLGAHSRQELSAAATED